MKTTVNTTQLGKIFGSIFLVMILAVGSVKGQVSGTFTDLDVDNQTNEDFQMFAIGRDVNCYPNVDVVPYYSAVPANTLTIYGPSSSNNEFWANAINGQIRICIGELNGLYHPLGFPNQPSGYSYAYLQIADDCINPGTNILQESFQLIPNVVGSPVIYADFIFPTAGNHRKLILHY
jgi:hypothetical protein